MNSKAELTCPPAHSDQTPDIARPPNAAIARIVPYPKPGSTAAAGPANTGYTIWSPAQMRSFKPDASANLLGSGYVALGEWTSLVGIGGLGKTRLVLWLCIAQIIGREWCGLKTGGKPQKCLMLSSESGLARWKSDLEKIDATLDARERALVDNHLRLLAITPDEEGDMNLGDEANRLKLATTIRVESPGLIVFDPFADMVMGDENSAADVVLTLRTLRGIQRKAAPKSAVIIIHHGRTGAGNVAQAGDNYNAGNFGRGSKTLYSRVRCEMQLAPGDRDNPNLIVLACGKANDTEKFVPRGIVFDPESFAYSVDATFDLDAWRSDVAGKRGNKSVSVTEVVRVVQELVKFPGDETKAGAICDAVKESTGACARTVKTRLGEAVKAEYLRKGAKVGAYTLGSKPLPK